MEDQSKKKAPEAADRSYAVQLVRYEPVSDKGLVAKSLTISLDELRLRCIGWLAAARVLDLANTDASLFPGVGASAQAIDERYQLVRSDIAANIEHSPFWQLLARVYRYAVQGDASLISDIMQNPAQDYWHYKLGFMLKTLSRVQGDWNETQPYCYVEDAEIDGFHIAPGVLLVLRFLARLKLDFSKMVDDELIGQLSAYLEIPYQGLSLAELAVLSSTSYSRIKSLTASHNRERSGLYTQHTSLGAYVSATHAAQWLRKEPGFVPSHSVYRPDAAVQTTDAAATPAMPDYSLHFITDGRRYPIDEAALQQQAQTLDPASYATNFCLIDKDGNFMFPVRMSRRGGGDSQFRVSDGGAGGNRLENSSEIDDQTQLKQLVLQEGKAVRAASLDGSKKGLYRLSGRTIVAAYDFDENKLIWGS